MRNMLIQNQECTRYTTTVKTITSPCYIYLQAVARKLIHLCSPNLSSTGYFLKNREKSPDFWGTDCILILIGGVVFIIMIIKQNFESL